MRSKGKCSVRAVFFLISRICGLFVLLLFFAAAHGQNDYSFKSSDEEIAMELSRVNGGVDITLMFSKASAFEYVMIEKSADAQNGFSQCKYIKFNESANDSVVIVKRDVYPLSVASDVFYRIKTVTKEGITRTYPPVRLPALHGTNVKAP